MAIDRRAEAYAEQHYPIFLSRYIAAAKAGRADIIPEPIREPISAYATGRTSRSNVNPGPWMKQASRHESGESVRHLRTYGDHAARKEVSRRSGLRSGLSVGVQM